MDGFDLNEMPAQVPHELLDRLRRIDTPTLGHIRDRGFMNPEIRAVTNDVKAVGTAVTVRITARDAALLPYTLGSVRAGDFLIIDRGGDRRYACWGGVVTTAAVAAGVAGAVIDGFATDFGEIRKMGFPIWCRGSSPVTTRHLANGGSLNVPVACGGVVVFPGDAVLADESGIAVLRPDEWEEATEVALGKIRAEPSVLDRIRRGEKMGELNGATEKVRAALERQSAAVAMQSPTHPISRGPHA